MAGSMQFLAEFDATGEVMVALVPPPEVARLLHDPGGEPVERHHVTLVYVGEEDDTDVPAVHRAVAEWCMRSGWRGLTGRVGGFGVFKGDEADVLYASWDIPHVEVFRTEIADALRAAGVPVEDTHGYIPHETIRYSAEPITALPEAPEGLPDEVVFVSVVVGVGGEWTSYDLSPGRERATEQVERAIALAFEDRPDVALAWRTAAGVG